MAAVHLHILSNIKALPREKLFTTKDFLGIANRASIDKALSTLAKNGELRRLARGIYDRPIKDPTFGVLPPDLTQVLKAIKRQTGDTLQIDGAKAANILGLSTQVPGQAVYLTNGYTRDIKIGSWVIKLKHTSPKNLAGAGEMTGCVLQALRFLGPHNVDGATAHKICATLSTQDKQQLKKVIHYAPGWAHSILLSITDGVSL